MEHEHTDPPAANTKPFSQYLIEQRQGGLHSELTEKMQQLVAAVEEFGQGGTLTLSIKVAPLKGAMATYVVVDDVKVKAPEGERGSSLFFGDGKGGLHRSDPAQTQLPLKQAPAPGPIKEVGGESR